MYLTPNSIFTIHHNIARQKNSEMKGPTKNMFEVYLKEKKNQEEAKRKNLKTRANVMQNKSASLLAK